MRIIIQKWQQLSDAAKSSISFALSTLIIKGISFITTPIFTRILSSSQYGVIATYNSWTSILEVFAILGLTSAGVFNVGLKDHKVERNQYVSAILILCNISTITVFLLIILSGTAIERFINLPMNLIIIMFIQFFFNPAQVFWVTRQRYEFKYKAAFIVTILSAACSQIVSVIAILSSNNADLSGAEIKIWSTNLSLLVFQIPIYIMILIRGKCFIDKKIWKDTLIFSLPLLPHYLAQHVMGNSDRIMISMFYSSSGAAIYSVVSTISMITAIVWSAINASLVPYTFESIDSNKSKSINRIIIPILIFYSIMCIGVTIIAPEVLYILAPEEYFDGVYAVPPIAATAFISALYNIYANIEFYHKKSWWIAFSTIISASVNIALNYMLIPQFGYIGASYTTLISHLVLIGMHYFGYRKCHPERIYNDKMILCILIATVTICIACTILYSNLIARYFSMIVLIVILVLNKDKFINKIKEIRRKD